MSENHRVAIDGGQHSVFLLPRLPYRAVSAIKWEVVMARDAAGGKLGSAEVLGILSEGYIIHGVAGWTLDVPFSREAVKTEILDREERAMLIGEEADGLYSPHVLIPLVKLGSTSSPATPTNGSTSVRNGSSTKPPKRSRRSSTSTTPTAVTETTTT